MPMFISSLNRGNVAHAAREVGEIDEVAAVHVVAGEYNVIAQPDIADSDDLPSVVTEAIHEVPPVVETSTSVAYEPEE
jgi:DNA-binding Lrp family transcriptional regulator